MPLGNTKDIQSDEGTSVRHVEFGTLKTKQSDSMDEHADLGLGFAIIV